MSAEMSAPAPSPFRSLIYHVMIFLALLVVGRFVLEIAGVPGSVTRYISSTVGVLLAALYLTAVAPLRGAMRKLKDLPLPAFILSAWTVGCVVLLRLMTVVFRIEGTHFATSEDFSNWARLGKHLGDHLIEIAVFFLLNLLFMAAIHTLWRWPVAVGPAVVLGALVIMRFTLESMGIDDERTAPWSSTMGVILAAFYLGGIAQRLGLNTSRDLLAPSFAISFAWRFWILIVTTLSALVPAFKTHFFDPTQGQVAWRLLLFFAGGFLIQGMVVGLLIWGIAIWISRATRPVEVSSS